MRRLAPPLTFLLIGWCYLTASSGHGPAWDESWFLQVVHRVTSGEVLYRDLFFSATPLSVYLTAAFAALFGAEILVVRAVGILIHSLIVVCSWRIARELGLTRGFPLLLTLALVVYAIPRAHFPPHYTPLATLFLLACFWAALRRSPHALAWAGLAAGLCFASKQNVGLYALAALLLARARGSDPVQSRGRQLLAPVVTFVGVAALALLPVLLSGAAAEFLDYCFLNTGTYVRLGARSYLDGLRDLATLLNPAEAVESRRPIYLQILFLAPPATLAALLWAWRRAPLEEQHRARTVLLFTGAGALGLYPVADLVHVIHSLPSLFLGIAYVWTRAEPVLGKRAAGRIRAVALVWLTVGLGVCLLQPAVRLATGEDRVCMLPRFRGAVISARRCAQLEAQVQGLARLAAGGEPLFLLSPEAALFYLTTGLRNPTPIDYPIPACFGVHGERDLIAALAGRRLRAVCLDRNFPGNSRPRQIYSYVLENMRPGHDAGVCTVYETPPAR